MSILTKEQKLECIEYYRLGVSVKAEPHGYFLCPLIWDYIKINIPKNLLFKDRLKHFPEFMELAKREIGEVVTSVPWWDSDDDQSRYKFLDKLEKYVRDEDSDANN